MSEQNSSATGAGRSADDPALADSNSKLSNSGSPNRPNLPDL